MAHGHTDRLLAGFVLLKCPRTTSEKLPGFALSEPEGRTHLRYFCGAEHPIHLGLQLQEGLLSSSKSLAIEDGLVAVGAPPAERPQHALVALVFDLVGLLLKAHLATAFGARLSPHLAHGPYFSLNTMTR